MSSLKGYAVIAAFAASTLATGAFAGPSHLNDSQYIAVARCGGMLASSAADKSGAGAINALLKSEQRGRSPDVLDRADQARDDAAAQARHAGSQADLAAARDRACQAWLGHSADAAAQVSTQPTGAN